jgi:copper chaperone CopZ
MTRATLTVDGMGCEACRTAVREALELPGVRQIDVSLETGIVDVTHAESVTVSVMVGAIEDTGYEVREAHSE